MEYQHFPSKIFCLSVPKIFAGETLCAVLQKISGSKKFVNKRGGEYQDFQSTFCLAVPKIFAGEPFPALFPKISGSEKD